MNDEDREELEAARRRIRELEDDASSLRQAIEQLSEDHRFRAAVIDQAAEGVCVCHDVPDFPFVAFTVWNQRMVEITGYTMDQINAAGWYQSMYPDLGVQERARARMDRMRQGANLSFERWEITHASGEKREIAISTSVLTAKDGAVHVLGLMHDFTERERLQTESMLARMDELTGVKNRRGFFENAGLLVKLAGRQGQTVTIAWLDVDNLKQVNDTRGHVEGDRLLETVGGVLANTLRSVDVVGRIGGDEFGIVVVGLAASDAEVLIGRLHSQLRDALRDHGWNAGVSIGAITFSQAPDFEEGLRAADALMYRAKKSGKGRMLCESVSLDSQPIPPTRKGPESESESRE